MDSKSVVIKYKNTTGKETPLRQTPGNIGVDIRSNQGGGTKIRNNGEPVMFHTGIFLEMPDFIWCQICPRSGLGSKGIHVHGGIIDSSYRGEIKVLLSNTGREDLFIENGDRIAQLIFHRVVPVSFKEVGVLTDTDRGDKGFGSSGMS